MESESNKRQIRVNKGNQQQVKRKIDLAGCGWAVCSDGGS